MTGTQQTAVTSYIVANGTKLAYRRLGLTSGIPLVMLMHFRYDDFSAIDNGTGLPGLSLYIVKSCCFGIVEED